MGKEGLMASGLDPWAAQRISRPVAPRRRFQLLDAMILVAATALACGIMVAVDGMTEGEISWRAVLELHLSNANQPPLVIDYRMDMLELWGETAFTLDLLSLPFFTLWTLALLPIRLRAPRPRFRHLACQPGTVAAFAVGVSLLLIALQLLTIYCPHVFGFDHRFDEDLLRVGVIYGVLNYPGLSVLVSWLVLLIGRRWCSEPSWVDRVGRAMGVYWIAQSFLGVFLMCGAFGL
jgi:hypothetical protein